MIGDFLKFPNLDRSRWKLRYNANKSKSESSFFRIVIAEILVFLFYLNTRIIYIHSSLLTNFGCYNFNFRIFHFKYDFFKEIVSLVFPVFIYKFISKAPLLKDRDNCYLFVLMNVFTSFNIQINEYVKKYLCLP